MTSSTTRATKSDTFPTECLRTSGLILETHLAMTAAFNVHAVEPAGLDRDLADLLVRLTRASDHQLRGIDIARQLFINPARTSRLIDRAEKAGLVVRLADPRDRRAQQVTLTPLGEETARGFAPAILEVIERTVFDTFSQKELDTLQRLLTRLRDAAQEVAADAVSE